MLQSPVVGGAVIVPLWDGTVVLKVVLADAPGDEFTVGPGFQGGFPQLGVGEGVGLVSLVLLLRREGGLVSVLGGQVGVTGMTLV